MPDYLFFLSYARSDLNANVKRFFHDLSEEVAQLFEGERSDANSPVAFFDREGVELGDIWDDELREAVHFSRVLVPLYTARYFERPYCGKEFAAFHTPDLAYSPASTRQPRKVLPVLWTPVGYPAPVKHIQADDGSFPADYEQSGLHQLMRLDSQNAYWLFLRSFARRITEIASATPSASGQNLSNLRELSLIPPMFPQNRPVPKAAVPVASASNLRKAQFVFIAARSGEVASTSGTADPYGAEEGLWKPFLALGEDKPIYSIAQEAAHRQNLEYDRMPIDGPLREAIDTAASAIIAIVDPRSVALAKYRKLTICCDKVLNHFAVLVPWVAPDDATDQEIRQIVVNAFPVLSARRDPRSLATGIGSTREMRKRLRKALTELYDMLLHEEIARRPVTSRPPPEVANK